jgi:hypothetical protein
MGASSGNAMGGGRLQVRSSIVVMGRCFYRSEKMKRARKGGRFRFPNAYANQDPVNSLELVGTACKKNHAMNGIVKGRNSEHVQHGWAATICVAG